MIIEEAIKRELLDTPDLTALVGDRIHYVRAPQDITKPYIVFFKVSAPRPYAFDGLRTLIESRFQISSFGSTYLSVKNVGAEVKIALADFTGTL